MSKLGFGVIAICALSTLPACTASTDEESGAGQDPLSASPGGLEDEGVVVLEGDPNGAGAASDKGADQPSPFCLNIARSIEHIAKNHVFGLQNLAGHTRKKGDGDLILVRFAKGNASGWHGAWDSKADAGQALDEAFASGCTKLVAFAAGGRVGDT